MTSPDRPVPHPLASRAQGTYLPTSSIAPLATSPGVSSESPALLGRRAGDAREIKFRLPVERLDQLSAALAARLARDPHGEPALDGDYRVASLYFDTPDLEVYRRIGWHRFRKFRVRRYGNAEFVFLERKTRLGDLVRKDRTPLPLGEVQRLEPIQAVEGSWVASDFRRQLLRRSLAPTSFIQYRRRAFFGTLDGSPSGGALRVTIDRDARGAATDGWSFGPRAVPTPLLLETPLPSMRGTGAREFMLVEIKFTTAHVGIASKGPTGVEGIPSAIKRLIAELGLAERGVSKYRRCMRLLGAARASTPEGEDDA